MSSGLSSKNPWPLNWRQVRHPFITHLPFMDRMPIRPVIPAVPSSSMSSKMGHIPIPTMNCCRAFRQSQKATKWKADFFRFCSIPTRYNLLLPFDNRRLIATPTLETKKASETPEAIEVIAKRFRFYF